MTLRTMLAHPPAGPVECRLAGSGARTVLVLHGGHLRAGVPVGEGDLVDAGLRVLTVSRPGYGLTPRRTAATVADFADALVDVCRGLGIDSLAGVVGQSHGGPTAVALAARHPQLARRLVLESSVSSLPWPSWRTRAAAHVLFNPAGAGLTWRLTRSASRLGRDRFLAAMLTPLTTLTGWDVLADLEEGEREEVLALFRSMDSGRGFLADVRAGVDADAEEAVACPALVIASRDDGVVPFRHAEHLAARLPQARLVPSRAPSHLIWFGSRSGDRRSAVCDFLA